MALDGGFLHLLLRELSAAVDCHVDKIYQPSHDELVFLLRKKGFSARLLLSARSGAARLHFTEEKTENPDQPPMFCMLARKYFSGARLTAIRQNGLERVAELCFETTNEMGDRVSPRLLCEVIGNQSNLILVGDDGRILDALRRSDPASGKRLIQPGAVYEPPEKQEKADLRTADPEALTAAILSGEEARLSDAVRHRVDGLSPLVCREIAFAATGGDPEPSAVEDPLVLAQTLARVGQALSGGTPTLLLKSDGVPSDFSFLPIGQYGSAVRTETFSGYSQLLDAFYARRDAAARMHKAAQDVTGLVGNRLARAQKRLGSRLQELNACADRESLRVFGELLKANLHLISPGQTSVTVPNYYDPDLRPVTVPLDPALSPAANAAKYFKDYKKSYTAEQTLTALTEKDREEIAYLETVAESIERCRKLSELAEIRQELAYGGYTVRRENASRRLPPPLPLEEHRSVEGYRIAVGHNNLQNDRLTTRLAGKNDWWFHVKGQPGSHVVVFCDGQPVSEQTIRQAAGLAAAHSRAKTSAQVPVDYTPIKYVKKPNGAKPGMVIYTTNRTVFVTPKGENE